MSIESRLPDSMSVLMTDDDTNLGVTWVCWTFKDTNLVNLLSYSSDSLQEQHFLLLVNRN